MSLLYTVYREFDIENISGKAHDNSLDIFDFPVESKPLPAQCEFNPSVSVTHEHIIILLTAKKAFKRSIYLSCDIQKAHQWIFELKIKTHES